MDKNIENVNKPWGFEQRFCINEKQSTVKILYIKVGEMTSYQSHVSRDEWILVIKGLVKVIWKEDDYDKSQIMTPLNEPMLIKRQVFHRFEAVDKGKDMAGDIAKDHAMIFEVSVGYYNDKDIVRIEDKYGRDVSDSPNIDMSDIMQKSHVTF